MKFFKKAAACVLACALALSTFIGVPALAAGTLEDKTGSVSYSESRIAGIASEYGSDVYYSAKVYYDGEYVMDIVQENTTAKSYIKNSVIDDGDYIFWYNYDPACSVDTSYYIIEAAKMAIVTEMCSMETISFPDSYDIEKFNAGNVVCGTAAVDGAEYYSETVVEYQTDAYTCTDIYCFEKGTANLACVVYKTIYADGSEVVTTYKLNELRHSSTADWNTLLPAGFPNGYNVS